MTALSGRLAGLGLGLALAVVLVAPAAAQDEEAPLAPEDDGRFERGRAAYHRAVEALDRGGFVGAREGFQEAYDLTQNPDLRYNLGLVERSTGHLDTAREHFRAFLRSNPSAERRALAERQLEQLDELEAATAAPEEPAPVEETAPDWAAFGVTLGVTAGIGVALAIGSGLVWADANATYADLEIGCAPFCTDSAIEASGLYDQTTMANVLWIAAVGTAVVGTTIAVVLLATSGGREEATARLRVGPGGLVAEGTF